MCGDWAPGLSWRRHPSYGRCRPCWKVLLLSGLMCIRRSRLRRCWIRCLGSCVSSGCAERRGMSHTDKAIRRGIFQSVPDLIDTIQAYLAAHNENPKPFQWTATAEQILEKVRRGRVTLDAIAS